MRNRHPQLYYTCTAALSDEELQLEINLREGGRERKRDNKRDREMG
jgi:hypothetical protein